MAEGFCFLINDGAPSTIGTTRSPGQNSILAEYKLFYEGQGRNQEPGTNDVTTIHLLINTAPLIVHTGTRSTRTGVGWLIPVAVS